MGNTWAIGDIHGHAGHFERLLEILPLQADDRIILLGDLIDRGPDSHRVLALAREVASAREFVYIRGNHEIMLLAARKNRAAIPDWLASGGDATLDAYRAKTLDDIPKNDWQLIENSRPYVETETAIYLHASFDPLLNMEHQSESDLFWRFCTNPAPHQSGKWVVCGHTLQKNGLPALWDRVLCVDTLEPPQNDWLTAVCMQKEAYFQVNSRGEVRFEPITSLEIVS